jgi:hypothetical protein
MSPEDEPRLGLPAAPGAVVRAWPPEFNSWNQTRGLTGAVSAVPFFQCLVLVQIVVRSNLRV